MSCVIGRAIIRRGEAHHAARLSADQVTEIRRRLVAALTPYPALALEFKVSTTTIWNIAHHLTWKEPS